MKRRLDKLIGFSTETTDGLKGKVKDFIFDEDNWIVRYLELDFGSFFNEKRVILPVELIDKTLWEEEVFSLNLSKDAIEQAPTPADKLTVSREYEMKISEFYGYQGYWLSGNVAPGYPGILLPARPIRVPKRDMTEDEPGTSLRSFREIEGYHIVATDGKIGHVEDLIVDDMDWQLVYLIVDTSNWKPWSKKVLLSIHWLDEISYVHKETTVHLDSEMVKGAPEFDSEKLIEEAYEKALFDYYNKYD
jgi:sporulation protein YlmC with PRC-barrel domain